MLTLRGYTYFGSLNNSFEMRHKTHHFYSQCFTVDIPQDPFCEHVEDLLEHHRKKKHNIIIASESFEWFTDTELQLLVKKLKAFSVTVVMFYRPFIDRIYSLFGQFLQTLVCPQPSFAFFENYYPALIEKRRYRFDEALVNSFAQAFGLKNLVIIDFRGALAAGRQPHQVFVCGVLKICKPEISYGIDLPQSIIANPARTDFRRSVQLFSLFYNYMMARGCNVNTTFQYLVKDLALNRVILNRIPSPVEISRVPHELILKSLKLDVSFRKKYSSNLLHSNGSENERIIKKFQYTEVDANSVSTDPSIHKIFDWIIANYTRGPWQCPAHEKVSG